jgi:hypothetical protein
MKAFPRTLAACLSAAALLAGPAAADPATSTQNETLPLLEKAGNGVYRLGDIVVDRNARSITFPAQVNMDKGMLEYLIVHRKGKTHESLLNTLVDPYNLQIAFLLLGFEGAEQKLAGQGDPAAPKGDRIAILIGRKAGAGTEVFPADRWLINKFGEETRDVPPMDWVYTGSFSHGGRFLSQDSGSITAIWHDPVALMDNASPGGESNRIWFVKEGTVPPVGTPVEVVIRPAK